MRYLVYRALHRRTYRWSRLNTWLETHRYAAALQGHGEQSRHAW